MACSVKPRATMSDWNRGELEMIWRGLKWRFSTFLKWSYQICEEIFLWLQTFQVRGRLETLWANSERLEMLASKEPVARRQAARSRVDQLKGDIQHLGAALQSLATRREARRREAEERELLLTTEFTTNAASRESETSIMIDRALEHQAALGRTNRWSSL